MSEEATPPTRSGDLTELLPCPFCGALAWMEKHGGVFTDAPIAYRVECQGACHAMTCYWHSEAEAIAAWNRRPSPKSGDPTVMTREDVARIIDPKAWARFDRNATVYAKHVTEEQRREWDNHFVADSLAKADAILSPLLQRMGELEGGLADALAHHILTVHAHSREGYCDIIDELDTVKRWRALLPIVKGVGAAECLSELADGTAP